jgi:hypothetical protein
MGQSKLTTTLLALDSLSIYRGLLKDEVLSRLKALLICLDKGDVADRLSIPKKREPAVNAGSHVVYM